MADDTRNVYVNLTMQIAGYLQGSAKVREANRQTMTEAQKLKSQVEAQKQALDLTGRALVGFGVAATAAFIVAVKASADFEQRMSQVQAISKATAPQMDKLRSAAFSAGKAFGLSATQVADAQIELVKAGVSVKDIIGGALPGALALAAAGQLDVGKATAIATTAMTQFKLRGSDVPHVADLLAAGADKSIASVESLGDSLNQSGQVAAQFGLSVEDTVGTLTAFSAAGLNGSDAGTSFKTMLTQLASPTQQAQALLEKYNITTYDAQGNFVGITALADNLRKGLGGLSQAQRNAALSTIFGNDAIRASSTLYDLGGKKLQGYIDANNEAGFAALQASKKLDNLNGDVQKLSAAFQNDLVKGGSAATNALRGVTQTATKMLDTFADAPGGVQAAALALTAAAGATTLAGGAFLLLVPKVSAAKVAMEKLNLTGKRVALTFAKGAAITVGLDALAGGLANIGSVGQANSQQLEQAALRIKGSYKDIDKVFPKSGVPIFDIGTQTGARGALEGLTGLLGQTQKLGADLIDGATAAITFGKAGTHLADVFKSNQETFAATGTNLAAFAHEDYTGATNSFNRLVKQLGGGVDTAKKLISPDVMPAYREELVALARQAGVTASESNLLDIAQRTGAAGAKVLAAQQALAAASAKAAASATNLLAGAANDGTVSVKQLQDAIAGLDGGQLDARAAARAYQAAVDDATASVKANGRTLDINTEAGRANQQNLDNLATTTKSWASSTLAAGGTQNEATKIVQAGRAEYVRQAIAMGKSAKAADALATSIFGIPAPPKLTVSLSNGAALQRIKDTIKALRDIDGTVANIYINAVNQAGASASKVSSARLLLNNRRADGGPIDGSGPKGIDSELILAAPGEHMVTHREVQAVGGQGAMYAIRSAMLAGTLTGYASGGAIGAGTRRGTVSAIQAQVNAEAAADAAATRYIAQVKAARTTASRLEKAYDDIDGTKKNASRKKAAKARSDAAAKKVDALEQKLEDARKKRDDAKQAAADLRLDREDFQTDLTRGSFDGSPTSLVDQLRQMSRDGNYSAARRKVFDAAANTADKSLADLAKQSEDAAKKVDTATSSLNDFTSASQQMASSISSSISGGFQASGAVLATSDQTVARRSGNLTYSQVVKGGSSVTASGLAAYYSTSASSAKAFAGQLQQLASRGVNGALLAEIAGYGVEAGAPIAAALLASSGSQLASINNDYASIQSSATAAGQTVADVNYKALIDAAQAQLNAENAGSAAITDAINAQANDLKSIIGRSFGLKGYKSGAWLTPGSPDEIAGVVHGQETVLNREQSLAYRQQVRDRTARVQSMGASYSSSNNAGSVTVVPSSPVKVQVAFADTALRSMVDVQIAQHDSVGAIELEVL